MQNTENKFKHDDLWYIAVEQDGCRNCEFSNNKKCTANDDIVPACNFMEREDVKDVIFVRSDVDNLGDEK